MQIPDPKFYQAVTNLRGSGDFAVVVENLKMVEQSLLISCRSNEGTSLYRAQGAATFVKELLESIASAPQTLDKFNRKI